MGVSDVSELPDYERLHQDETIEKVLEENLVEEQIIGAADAENSAEIKSEPENKAE